MPANRSERVVSVLTTIPSTAWHDLRVAAALADVFRRGAELDQSLVV